MDTYAFTLYPSVFRIWEPTAVSWTWPEVVARFTSTPYETTDKLNAPAFGPYRLLDGRACAEAKHRARPEYPAAHRCNAFLDHISMFVVDADKVTPRSLDRTLSELESQGIRYLWYSSYRYTPEEPKGRILIPFASPVAFGQKRWERMHDLILDRFHMPADAAACSGGSHTYFVPAVPPGGRCLTRVFDGSRGLDPAELGSLPPLEPVGVNLPADWRPPEHTAAVDTAPLVEVLKTRVGTLARGSDAESRTKAEWLRRALAGRPLEDGHGRRNIATSVTAAVMVYALPDLPTDVIAFLLRPSVDAMIAAGSKLTHEAVATMVLSSQNKKKARDLKREQDRQDREAAQRRIEAEWGL